MPGKPNRSTSRSDQVPAGLPDRGGRDVRDQLDEANPVPALAVRPTGPLAVRCPTLRRYKGLRLNSWAASPTTPPVALRSSVFRSPRPCCPNATLPFSARPFLAQPRASAATPASRRQVRPALPHSGRVSPPARGCSRILLSGSQTARFVLLWAASQRHRCAGDAICAMCDMPVCLCVVRCQRPGTALR